MLTATATPRNKNLGSIFVFKTFVEIRLKDLSPMLHNVKDGKIAKFLRQRKVITFEVTFCSCIRLFSLGRCLLIQR